MPKKKNKAQQRTPPDSVDSDATKANDLTEKVEIETPITLLCRDMLDPLYGTDDLYEAELKEGNANPQEFCTMMRGEDEAVRRQVSYTNRHLIMVNNVVKDGADYYLSLLDNISGRIGDIVSILFESAIVLGYPDTSGKFILPQSALPASPVVSTTPTSQVVHPSTSSATPTAVTTEHLSTIGIQIVRDLIAVIKDVHKELGLDIVLTRNNVYYCSRGSSSKPHILVSHLQERANPCVTLSFNSLGCFMDSLVSNPDVELKDFIKNLKEHDSLDKVFYELRFPALWSVSEKLVFTQNLNKFLKERVLRGIMSDGKAVQELDTLVEAVKSVDENKDLYNSFCIIRSVFAHLIEIRNHKKIKAGWKTLIGSSHKEMELNFRHTGYMVVLAQFAHNFGMEFEDVFGMGDL